MGLTSLRAFLRRHQQIGLDTSVFICQLEANPKYSALTDEIFGWLARPDQRCADSFYGLLSTYPNLVWLPPDLEGADIAAELRAAHRPRTPDALQAATAVRVQATGRITNDPLFQRVDLG